MQADGNSVSMHTAIGRAAVCLTLSVAASALMVLALESMVANEFNLLHAANALTIGFVSICANVVTCEPWAAVACGAFAGVVYVRGRRLLAGLQDHDVFCIHGLGGIWGLAFTGFLARPKFVRDVIGLNFYPERVMIREAKGQAFRGTVDGLTPWIHHGGSFYPDDIHADDRLLGCMVLEMLVVFGWGFVMGLPLFAVLHAFNRLHTRSASVSKSRSRSHCIVGTLLLSFLLCTSTHFLCPLMLATNPTRAPRWHRQPT